MFFSFHPATAAYSTVATKDVAFAALFAMCVTLIADMMIREESGRKRLILLWVCVLVVILFRNNVPYAAIFVLPVAAFLFRGKRVKVTGFICPILLMCLIVTGPIYAVLGVVPTSVSEALSAPLT